jgi:hypothetical protein
MRKNSAFGAGIWSAIASPGAILSTPNYPTLAGSDLDRLRGDVRTVGGDFAKVIRREHGKTTKQK